MQCEISKDENGFYVHTGHYLSLIEEMKVEAFLSKTDLIQLDDLEAFLNSKTTRHATA